MNKLQLKSRLEQIGGCGDGNCIVSKPVGMHTNGGCRCHQNEPMKMRLVIRALKDRIATLEGEVV